MGFEKEAIEWIDGELLGDGRLELTSSSSVRFRYTSKCFEYIEYNKQGDGSLFDNTLSAL